MARKLWRPGFALARMARQETPVAITAGAFDMRNVNVGQIDYQAGAPRSLPNGIPRDFPIYGLSLRLAGRLTVSGGTTSGTAWVENPMTLIERIRVFGSKHGSGSVTVIDLSGASLWEIAHYFARTDPELVTTIAGAAASYDFACEIPIPLHLPNVDAGSKMASLLPTHLFSDLQLEIKWRDGASTTNGGLISAGDRTLALTAFGSASGSPSVRVIAHQVTNAPQVAACDLFRLYSTTLVTEAAEAARKVPLNLGALYRALLLKAWTDTTTRATLDTLITNVKLLVGGNSQEDWPWASLQAFNKRLFGLEGVNAGYGMLDLAPNGKVSTFLDASDFALKGVSLELELALAGAANNRVDVITFEGIPAGKW